MASELKPESLGANWMHVCVDLQQMFREGSSWSFPWPETLLRQIERLCSRSPQRNIFTRFIPAVRDGEGAGTWQRVYKRWPGMTVEQLGPAKLDLVPELAPFRSAASLIDRSTYSAWSNPSLGAELARRMVGSVIISGVETDMCVLATVLGAIDRGYRTILVTDAVHSSAQSSHDAVLELLQSRFSEQLELTTTDELLEKVARAA